VGEAGGGGPGQGSLASAARSGGAGALRALRMCVLPVDLVVFAVFRATVPVFGLPSSPWQPSAEGHGVLYVLDRASALLSPAGVMLLAYAVVVLHGGMHLPWAPFAVLAAVLTTVSASSLAAGSRGPAWLWMILTLAGAIAWVHVLADLIVTCLTLLSGHLAVDASVLALTLLTWGNSIPDLVADLSLARSGHTRMALAGAFAGPFFNLTIGFGLPALWANVADPLGGWASDGVPLPWDPSLTLAVVFLSTVLLVTTVCGTRWKRLGSAYGASLIAGYASLMAMTSIVHAFLHRDPLT